MAFLRVLLIFWDLDHIRIFLLFVSSVLLIFDVMAISKWFGHSEGAVFGLTYFVSGMFINAMCPTYFTDIFIVQCGILALYAYSRKKEWSDKTLAFFFFSTGSFTMFFTWYSCPLLTLCIPMILAVHQWHREKMSKSIFGDFFHRAIKLLIYSLSWCGGYICTMLSKSMWCAAARVEDTAIGHIGELIGDAGAAERMDVIALRWEQFFTDKIVFLVVAAAVVSIVFNLVIGRKRISFCLVRFLTWFTIALYPCVWQFVFAYHAFFHGVEGYLYVITIFAFLTAISGCFETVIENEGIT